MKYSGKRRVVAHLQFEFPRSCARHTHNSDKQNNAMAGSYGKHTASMYRFTRIAGKWGKRPALIIPDFFYLPRAWQVKCSFPARENSPLFFFLTT